MDRQHTADRHALTALARTMGLGIDARKALTCTQMRTMCSWRDRPSDTLKTAVARTEARRLARAVVGITTELEENRAALTRIVDTMAVDTMALGLLEAPGVGPVTAAILLVTYSHHGRVRFEAAFAALADVNPTPASSGNTVRHRLGQQEAPPGSLRTAPRPSLLPPGTHYIPVVQRTGADAQLRGRGGDGLTSPHEGDGTEPKLGREGSWRGQNFSMRCTNTS